MTIKIIEKSLIKSRKKPTGHKAFTRMTPTGKLAQIPQKGIVNPKITFHNPKETGHHDNIAIKRITVNGKPADVTYYEDPKNPENYGVEFYMGENYIVDSNDKSWSRVYKQLKGLPKGLESHVEELKEAHKKKYG